MSYGRIITKSNILPSPSPSMKGQSRYLLLSVTHKNSTRHSMLKRIVTYEPPSTQSLEKYTNLKM